MAKMSDVELVVASSSALERRLRARFGARGGRARSCRGKLPEPVIRSILRLAAERNAVAHEGAPLRDRRAFVRLADHIEGALDQATNPRSRSPRAVVWSLPTSPSCRRARARLALASRAASEASTCVAGASKESGVVGPPESRDRAGTCARGSTKSGALRPSSSAPARGAELIRRGSGDGERA
jgi:hypothetical protein